jgi:hypothetical protein
MNETSIRLVDSETRAPLPLSPKRALSAANLREAIDEIKRWATEQGLQGATARDLFEGYCRRLEAHGFTLMRAYVSTQTLHPQWTGYGYTWKHEWQSVREQQFARGGPISQERLASPFYALIQRSQAGEKKVWMRRRLEVRPGQRYFPGFLQRGRHGLSLPRIQVRGERRSLARDWRSLFLHDRPSRLLP